MEIADLKEQLRVLQTGTLELRTIDNGIRAILAVYGPEALVPLLCGRYGVHLNGQAPNWVCPLCRAKKFCPVLQLPYHMEVECDAGVLMCDQCRHCQVVPVRLGLWGNFGEIKRPKLAAVPLSEPPVPEIIPPLTISDEIPSLKAAAELIRVEDACGRFRSTACHFVCPDSVVRWACRGNEKVGFSIYSLSSSGLCWWDVAVAIPGDVAVVGQALFAAMRQCAWAKLKLVLHLKLLHTRTNAHILAACGIQVPPRRGEHLRLTVPLKLT